MSSDEEEGGGGDEESGYGDASMASSSEVDQFYDEGIDQDDDSQDEYRPSPPPNLANVRNKKTQNRTQPGHQLLEYQDEEYQHFEDFEEENNLFSNNGLEENPNEILNMEDGYDQYQGDDNTDLNILERWKQVGYERRRRQAEKAVEQEQDGEVELEEDRFQDMANALADVSEKPSMDNVVERWGKTLHADEDLEEEMDELAFEQDLRGATGFRQKRIRGDGQGKRSRRIAPRQQAVSPEARALLAQANMAYAMNDIPETMAKLTEVIRIEPTIRSAWGTLALCHESKGDTENELLCRVMEAQLTSNPLSVWYDLALRFQDIAFADGITFCMNEAILSSREKDRSDVMDIMWERAQLLLGLNNVKAAIKQFLRILDFQPQNEEVIREVIPLLHGLNMKERAIVVMQNCAKWNMEAFPDPNNIASSIDEYDQITYNSDAIATVADLLLELGRPQDAIHAIRSGTRWLQGRRTESFWDEIQDDDREFDENRSDQNREGDYGRRINMAPEYDLDIEFRFRLGVARARMGNVEETRYHFDIWRGKVDVFDNIDHWTTMVDEMIQLASSLDEEDGQGTKQLRNELFLEAGEYARVVNEIRTQRYYDTTQGEDGDEETAGLIHNQLVEDYKRLATCNMGLGLESVASGYWRQVVEACPDDLEAKLRLAETLEVLDADRAIQLVSEVIRQRRINTAQAMQDEETQPGEEVEEEEDTVTQSLSIFAEASNPQKSKAASRDNQRKQLLQIESLRERETIKSYEKVQALNPHVFINRWWHPDVPLNGDPQERIYGYNEEAIDRQKRFDLVSEWVAEMEGLITMFSETPQLFPRDKSKRFRGMFRVQRRQTDRLDKEARALLARMRDQVIVEEATFDSVEHTRFRGIELDEWMNLVMQYAFVLTKINQFNMARRILRRVIRSNVVWTSDQRRLSLSLCFTSCALYAGRIQTIFTESALRFLPFLYQFHTEALRSLLVLSNSTGYAGHKALMSANNIKFFLRRSRIHEALVQGVKSTFNRSTRRWVVQDSLFDRSNGDALNDEVENDEVAEGGEEDDLFGADIDDDQTNQLDDLYNNTADDGQSRPSRNNASSMEIYNQIKGLNGIEEAKHKPPTRYNPANELFYAGLLLTSSNGIPSMAYCLRIYARFPNDPLVCLASAVACLGRASNRQVDNRHQVVMQAFAFLHRYRDLRRKNGDLVQSQQRYEDDDMNKNRRNIFEGEIQYNFARVAHQLGLYQLAVPHYNDVLKNHRAADNDVNIENSNDKMELDNQEIDPALLGEYGLSDHQTKAFDCSTESAFGLHLVYLASGNPLLANSIIERFLRV